MGVMKAVLRGPRAREWDRRRVRKRVECESFQVKTFTTRDGLKVREKYPESGTYQIIALVGLR